MDANNRLNFMSKINNYNIRYHIHDMLNGTMSHEFNAHTSTIIDAVNMILERHRIPLVIDSWYSSNAEEHI